MSKVIYRKVLFGLCFLGDQSLFGGEAWEQAAGLRAGGWGLKSWIPSRKQREWTQWRDLNSQSLSHYLLQTRLYLPNLSKQRHHLGTKYQNIWAYGDILIQITRPIFFNWFLKNCRQWVDMAWVRWYSVSEM